MWCNEMQSCVIWTRCSFHIVTHIGNVPVIKICCTFSFQDFEIQSSHRCGLDWISIGTYKNLDGYRACGSSIPAPYISSQDHVWIKFHSDDSMTGKGFRLSYITGRPAIYIPLDTAVSERMHLHRCLALPCDTRKFTLSNCIWSLKMTAFSRMH